MGAKKKKHAPKSTVEALPTGGEVHHPRLGDVLGPAVGAAADAELEPDDESREEEHDAKSEEP